jgi:hypothetical protein
MLTGARARVPGPSQGPTITSLFSMSASSLSDVWAIGRDTEYNVVAVHWDGQEWKDVALPTAATNLDLQAITSLSPENAWIVGAGVSPIGMWYTSPEFLHWNGIEWSLLPVSTRVGGGWLSAVAALNPNDIWAVGHMV